MKKIYYAIITIVLIYGLLCPPQVLWAEDLPDTNQESTKPELTSFDEYNKTRELEKEALENLEEIDNSQDPEDAEELVEIVYTKDENGDVRGIKIDGQDLTLSVNASYNSAVRNIFSEANTMFSDHPTENVQSDQALAATYLADSDIPDIDVKINDQASDEPLDINNEEGYAPAIKQDLSTLLKAHESAMKKFYADASPYYKKLAAVLEKAQWLWRQRNIDPHLYYAGADGILDEKEMRRRVEDSINYLYENAVALASEQAELNAILGAEKDLRGRYIDPALNLYKRDIKESSREFYKSVKETVEPLVSPFVNKAGGKLEVIISLPKTTLE